MSEQNKTIIVAGLWKTSNGHYNSMPVDAKAYDALVAAFEQGGKFLIRNRTEAAIQGSKNPDTTPVAYLEFVPAQSVAEFKAAQEARKAGGI